jgi:primosomal protein N' (replication factor Y)
MDSDTMKGREAYDRVLAAFRAKEFNLLIGTQMIAKGLDFPDVTVVGVLNADIALHYPDFRAAERTFQLLAQVAGRAGRAGKIGRVVVQTSVPEHPAILRAAQHDFEGFAAAEMKERKALGYPPYARILRVVTLAVKPAVAREMAAEAKAAIEAAARGVRILGPAPTFLEMIKGRSRFHLLALAPDARALAASVAAVRPLARKTRDRELLLDVDPLGTA